MLIATDATKQFLKGQLSTLMYCKVVDFDFYNQTRFTAILSSKKRIPDFEFNIFRGMSNVFQRYLNTFKKI